MEPQRRPSARDVFDVISRVQLAQEQAAQDPWDANEGPPHVPSQPFQPVPATIPHAPSLRQADQHTDQLASSSQQQHGQSSVQQVPLGAISDRQLTDAASPVDTQQDHSI